MALADRLRALPWTTRRPRPRAGPAGAHVGEQAGHAPCWSSSGCSWPGGAGRGAPRGGRRAPGRGAVRLARAGGRGDGDRGRADRHADGLRRGRRRRHARARHRVRGGDDHLQRDGRDVRPGRRAAPATSRVQRRRGRRPRWPRCARWRRSRSSCPLHHEQPGPEFSSAQLAFAGVASIVLYGLFVVVQTVRHRDYFLPVEARTTTAHAPPPSDARDADSLGLLLVALVAVVGLAKTESPAIEDGVDAIGAPRSAVGVAIALLVLLPETLAAIRNAGRDRVQTSFNLAYGSAIASIGLTIPAIAVASIWLDGPLVLGLGATQMVLLGDHRAWSARSRCCPAARRCRRAACTSCCSRPSCSWPCSPRRAAPAPPGPPRPGAPRPRRSSARRRPRRSRSGPWPWSWTSSTSIRTADDAVSIPRGPWPARGQ